MNLILGAIINEDNEILEAVKLANTMWDDMLTKNEYSWYDVSSIQHKLERYLGISEGKELTVVSGLFRFYDNREGFSREEHRSDLLKVAQLLKGHCMEMDMEVEEILGEYGFYKDRVIG